MHACAIVYKMLYGKSAVNFSRFLSWRTVVVLVGTHSKLKKDGSTLIYIIVFFSKRIVNIWNALDDHLVCSSSLNVFKNGLYLLSKNDRLPMGLL